MQSSPSQEKNTYHEPKYDKDKDFYFANSYIFVFPSYNETLGLVNLEAIQYKLLIVTTKDGDIYDVVKDGVNGCFCERMDSVSLANGIEKLLKDKESCIELGENGYKIFKEKFTLEIFNNNITKILKEII